MPLYSKDGECRRSLIWIYLDYKDGCKHVDQGGSQGVALLMNAYTRFAKIRSSLEISHTYILFWVFHMGPSYIMNKCPNIWLIIQQDIIKISSLINTRGVSCHTMALPFASKSILWQKKIYGNSNIFDHAKNIIFKKSSKRNQNSSIYYYNFITNLFQHKPKPSYKNKPIT